MTQNTITSPASASASADAGYLCGGLPYCRIGRGPLPLVVFQGLMFENTPPPRMTAAMYRFLGADYTIYSVLRRSGLPRGTGLVDMAAHYAAMIRAEFGGPVDVIGISTGGSIAFHFAADHPELLRRLVLHSSAYTLCAAGKQVQLRVAALAREGRWREAWQALLRFVMQSRTLAGPLSKFSALLLSIKTPKDCNDLVVTVEAEDAFDFRDRLAQIAAPTLVAAGELDPFYSVALFRETAAGIPNARLALYPSQGHPAGGKEFQRDVLAFLREGR